jgi:MoaA/NifB/PqqE/SkfB family radical SAM enzyme
MTRSLFPRAKARLKSWADKLAAKRLYARDRVKRGPEVATVIIEGRCNLSCRMCVYHSREIPRPRTYFTVSYDQFRAVLDVLVANGLKWCHICATGEPFVNKDIFMMIKYSKDQGLTTSVLSNGSGIITDMLERIVDSGLDYFKADFDSGDPRQIEYLKRGIRYDDLESNLRKLVSLRNQRNPRLKIMLDSIVMKSNYMHLRALFQKAADIGVDAIMLSYLVPMTEEFELMSTRNAIGFADGAIREDIASAIDYGHALGLEISRPNLYDPRFGGKQQCRSLWHKVMVNLPSPSVPKEDWVGNVGIFCKLFATSYGASFGNILKQPFDAVWNGEKMLDLRRRLRTGRSMPRICIEECPNYCDPNATMDPRGRDCEERWLYGERTRQAEG